LLLYCCPAEPQNLFDSSMDANSLVAGIEKEEQLITAARRVTPKMFAHSIKSKCLANPQHIVLPEVRLLLPVLLLLSPSHGSALSG
jgi:hypothetical protein